MLPLLLTVASAALAQSSIDNSYFARRNSFGVFGSYSGDSSHILLGEAENRKLLNIGVSYSRRLFLSRNLNLQYNAELLPVALESDPVIHETQTFIPPSPFAGFVNHLTFVPVSPCRPATGTVNLPVDFSYKYVDTCGRRWSIGEAMSPAGLQLNFSPRRKLQPFLSAHGGYMYSTQPVPVYFAGSFNFTFDLGVGIEIYRSKTRSIRAEYRYHHISNDDTANANPGIDSGLFQVSYVFGR